jgi:Sulfatase-modifying factor enzyme 1
VANGELPCQPNGWLDATDKLDWPILVNLRLDPYERSGMPDGKSGSLAYYNWFAFEVWRFVLVQQEVAKAALTFLDFPPMQKGRQLQHGGGHPSGSESSIEGRHNHPVVNVAYEEAQAYAGWLGRALPSEAQWEFAARGGLEGATYSWGDEYYDPVVG